MKSSVAKTEPQAKTGELGDFHRYVAKMLKNGSANLSPEQALKAWREQQRETGEFEDDTEAILEAIQDMENGDTGRPFDEVMAEIRAKYGLPEK
jgi:hypothetical protein